MCVDIFDVNVGDVDGVVGAACMFMHSNHLSRI
jgi:hypothetical protein